MDAVIRWSIILYANIPVVMISLTHLFCFYLRLSETLADFAERIIVLKIIYRRILNRWKFHYLLSVLKAYYNGLLETFLMYDCGIIRVFLYLNRGPFKFFYY